MPALKLSTKRQATFPVEACEALRIGPGDVIEMESRVLDGEEVWLLRPRKQPDRPWLGCLGSKTEAAEHSMERVRENIVIGRRKERA